MSSTELGERESESKSVLISRIQSQRYCSVVDSTPLDPIPPPQAMEPPPVPDVATTLIVPELSSQSFVSDVLLVRLILFFVAGVNMEKRGYGFAYLDSAKIEYAKVGSVRSRKLSFMV